MGWQNKNRKSSSPARGTWIEIEKRNHRRPDKLVVPRKGDVDRNYCNAQNHKHYGWSSPARGTWIEINLNFLLIETRFVVPRKGDVDRNFCSHINRLSMHVVPRKGDVDRNYMMLTWGERIILSSPARGTWIEIFIRRESPGKEKSSPARGTWIEIFLKKIADKATWVVPRKGDVDRNGFPHPPGSPARDGRPPQGGRG